MKNLFRGSGFLLLLFIFIASQKGDHNDRPTSERRDEK
jgi:hypothetical protein